MITVRGCTNQDAKPYLGKICHHAVMPRLATNLGWRQIRPRLTPFDATTDSLRLRAYLWPDQPHRRTLTDAALALPHAPVDKADAIDWLTACLPHIAGRTHMIYTTIAWQYFPAEKQRDGLAMIKAAGAMATPDTPLAFVQMENDGGDNGAALTLRLWPHVIGSETTGSDQPLTLGRIDFHGRWID
jgi:hypothetical protein